MCGSQDLIKQGGYYVCQNCGTKYDPEEAKKLMVEVSGSVTIDNTKKLENLYELARRSFSEGDFSNAEKYYQEISVEAPDDWETHFFKVLCKHMNGVVANMPTAAISVGNCLDTTKKLIYKLPSVEQRNDPFLAVLKASTIYSKMYSDTINRYIREGSKTQQTADFIKKLMDGQSYLQIKMGDFILRDDDGLTADEKAACKEVALACYEPVLAFGNSISPNLYNLALNNCKAINPSYEPKSTSKNSNNSGGCYVATAVYGSYNCPEVWTLRRYRDYTLAETWYGRAFIHTYYAISPTLVKWFGETEWFKNMWKPKLDKMVKELNEKGVADTPYQDRNW